MKPLSFLFLFLVSCATHTVKTTKFVSLLPPNDQIDEYLLLDIGIHQFDVADDLETGEAESRYISYTLSNNIRKSGNWGNTYVLPGKSTVTDVYIAGTLMVSNGEETHVDIKVTDATGKVWYTKEYREIISQFSYEAHNEPFQSLYNNIVNDLYKFKNKIDDDQISNIRDVSGLIFAKEFLPDAFSDYLYTNRSGITVIERLPSENDPLFANIIDMREKDYMFVDTVQDYYDNFARTIRPSYNTYRKLAYNETIEIKKLSAAATRRQIIGAATIIAGVAGLVGSDSYIGRAAGVTGIGAGTGLIIGGYNKRQEAKIHITAMAELNDSFANRVVPLTIDLDNKQIILTGNIEEQYKQWKKLLIEKYIIEFGL